MKAKDIAGEVACGILMAVVIWLPVILLIWRG